MNTRTVALTALTALGVLGMTSCSKDTTINEGDTFIILTGAQNPFGVGEEELTEVKFNYVPVGNDSGKSGKTTNSGKSASTAKTVSDYQHEFKGFDLFLTWENAPDGARTIKIVLEDGLVLSTPLMLPANGDYSYEWRTSAYNSPVVGKLQTTNTVSNTFVTGTDGHYDIALPAQTQHGVLTVQSTTATITDIEFGPYAGTYADFNSKTDAGGRYFIEGISSVVSVTFTFEGETYTTASSNVDVEAYNHYDYTLNVSKGEDVMGNEAQATTLTIVLGTEFSTVSQTIEFETPGDVTPDDEGDFTLATEVSESDVITQGGNYIVNFNGVQYPFEAKLTTIDGGTVFAYVNQHELSEGTQIYHGVMQILEDDNKWNHVTVDKVGANYELGTVTGQHSNAQAKAAVAWVFNHKIIPLLD